jgi:short-subunit dehydrogenase
MKIDGKVFVVTGGGNGIGREVTLALLERGAWVAAVDLDKKGLADTVAVADAGERLSTHVVNVADRAAVAALPKAVIAAHGSVDGLLNVAGVIQKFVKVVDLPFDEVDKVMNVNFGGVIAMCKAFLPHLLERPEAALLNVASMGAFAAVPGQAVYGASKAAVSLLTEALYAELMGTNVAVTAIYPGAIDTNIAANSGVGAPGGSDAATSEFKTTSPVDAALVIVKAIEKGKFRDTIGSDAAALDKLHRFSPKRATEMIAKKMASLLG